MSAASWVRCLFAAAMLAVALYHLLRLARRGRHAAIDLDVAHAAMGTTMAAMLLGVGWLSGETVVPLLFAGAGCWFAVRAVRGFVLVGGSAVVPPAQAGAGCVAMLVMLVGSAGSSMTTTPTGAMTMASADDRSIGIALIVTTVALAGWTVGRWWAHQHRTDRAAGVALACQLAMNVTTVAMLAIR